MSMRITPNVTAMRQAFAPAPYPGTIPALSKLLALRLHTNSMVILVTVQPLVSLPVVPLSLKHLSTVNVTLYTFLCSL